MRFRDIVLHLFPLGGVGNMTTIYHIQVTVFVPTVTIVTNRT